MTTPVMFDLACPFENAGLAYAAIPGFNPAWQASWFAGHGIAQPDSVARSVLKRQREFFYGRLCARAVIQQLQPGDAGDVGLAADRRPLFPVGLSGSITHNDDFAAAVCMPARCGSVGIDAEPIMPAELAKQLAAQIADADELRIAQAISADSAVALTAIYSAKEALFKALYPHILRLPGFEASRLVAFDVQRGELSLALTEDMGAAGGVGHVVSAKVGWLSNRTLTLVVLGASAQHAY